MKKKDFALGILCGAMLFNGATAAAAGITAEPSWQNIYVDGEQVSMPAYNIAGNNYVKLRDIGQKVGFNVYWQDGVQIDTDAPYTGKAPVQEADEQPTIEKIRQEMILRINEVRRENGVSELIVNQSLMDASQEYSLKLYATHKNLVECKTALSCGYPHGFGSNLTVLVGTGMNRIAEKAVTNWVNSPGHFETMIDADCDTLGVGVTIDNGRAFCYMMVGNPNAYNPYA